jgi:oxygen-independent coproporphyrinogen III oxidase
MEPLKQLRHSGLFEARVPRYTSYPPASRFVPAEGKLHQRQWLNAVPHGAALSIYLHIPYCNKLCWFCACRTQAADRQDVVSDYLDVLHEEIELIRKELPDSVTLSRLYLGGGTPTLLLPDGMRRLLDAIYRAFPPGDPFECAVEIDTTQVSEDMISELIRLGMTRAVVGVQDFDPRVQKAIGRVQSFEQTLGIVRTLRAEGLQNLDMELLYGLPFQTAASIAQTTQQVLALDPDRVAVCEYAHVPNVAKRQILVDTRLLPEAEDAFVMSRVARDILLTDGYEAVGIDHYVRPGDSLVTARDAGRLRRDFQGYSDNATYAMIGLGASAISRFPQGYIQNASATSAYAGSIREKCLGGNRGYSLTGTDMVIAHMIEMLMCTFSIDIAKVADRFPGSTGLLERAIDSIGSVFAPHVQISPDALLIKPSAHPMARLISSILDRLGSEEFP